MSKQTITVADDIVVSLNYVLNLEDGEEVDRSDGEPLQFLQGHGQIIPGLEKALYGMTVGDTKNVVIEAAEAYGEYDEEDMQLMPRASFPDDIELEEGMGLYLRDTQSGQRVQAFVAEIMPSEVLLDFNHPLAGETLHFQVEIADLRAATSEELSHGHVHIPGHSH